MFRLVAASNEYIVDPKPSQVIDDIVDLEDTHNVLFVVESRLFTMLRYLELASHTHQAYLARPSSINDSTYPYSGNVVIPLSILAMNRQDMIHHNIPPRSSTHLLEVLASGEYAKDVENHKNGLFDRLVKYIDFTTINIQDKSKKISTRAFINSKAAASDSIFESIDYSPKGDRYVYYVLSTRHVEDVCEKANSYSIEHVTYEDRSIAAITTQIAYEPIFSLMETEKIEDMEKIFLSNDPSVNRYLRCIDKVEEIRKKVV